MVDITPTEKTRTILPTLGKAIQDAAFKQADEFISAGQSAREATSIVANLMIREAWTVAAIGALSDGDEPNKDRFRANVEAILADVQFKRRDEP